MKNIIKFSVIILLGFFYNYSSAQFTDCFAESEWTIGTLNTGPNTITPGVVFNNTAGTMTLTADGDFMGVSGTSFPAGIPFDCTFTDGIVKACIDIPNAGTIVFDWSYTMQMFFEDPANEPFGYCINGDDFVSLVTPGIYADQSGTASIEVNAGDIFCIVQASYFSEEFQAVTTVSNFSAPSCAAPVTTLTECYAEENWTVTTANSSGSATFGSNFLVISNDTDFSGTNMDVLACSAPDGMETVCLTMPSTGDFTFTWFIEGGGFSYNALIDRFGYCLNGVVTELSSINPPPFGTSDGTVTVAVEEGDEFCFVYASKFGDSGSIPVTLNNFIMPPCPLEFMAGMTADSQTLMCNGDETGSIVVETVNTTGEVTYEWNSELASGANPMNLPAGEYCCVITNGDGASIELCTTITEPDALEIVMSSSPDSGINDGTATAVVTGGTVDYSYSWNTDPEQTTATALGLDFGDYAVTVTDNNGCIIIDSVFVEESINISEKEGLNFLDIYPNPSEGRFIVDLAFSNATAFSIILTNAIGEEIIQSRIDNQQHYKNEFDWSYLASGIYTLNISYESKTVTRKIIIQH